ncbi:MAG TPA: hypothetical protein VMF10_07140 [Candidatus Aquilonibacter sp.]|nr:hypothetical protein [Candidatus Aquilonibacter sp.]
MHRLTARLLLVFALAGNLIPLAMALTAAPPRACCLRMAHRCHESATAEGGRLFVQDPCCCNNRSRHAATTAQWAHPKSRSGHSFLPAVERLARSIQSPFAGAQAASLHSSRAPPVFSIA